MSENPKSGHSLKDTFVSVMYAFIGVQSNKNREKDFSQGKFSQFVVVGFIAVILFIAALVAVVSMVVPSSGLVF